MPHVITVSTHSRAEAAAGQFVLLPAFRHVSTHSRAEAAAVIQLKSIKINASFNTQPRGGGCSVTAPFLFWRLAVSTHSRAEAAARHFLLLPRPRQVSTHSRAEAAACYMQITLLPFVLFQHTAARRRLPPKIANTCFLLIVSTHSRAEAAAPYLKKQEKSAY